MKDRALFRCFTHWCYLWQKPLKEPRLYPRLPDVLSSYRWQGSINAGNSAAQYKVSPTPDVNQGSPEGSSLMGPTPDSGQAYLLCLYHSRPSKVQGESESHQVHSRLESHVTSLPWALQIRCNTLRLYHPLNSHTRVVIIELKFTSMTEACWQQELPSSVRNQVKFFQLLFIFLKLTPITTLSWANIVSLKIPLSIP